MDYMRYGNPFGNYIFAILYDIISIDLYELEFHGNLYRKSVHSFTLTKLISIIIKTNSKT